MTAPAEPSPSDAVPPASQTELRWDTSQLKSSYCNVCHATATREEVVLNFAVNQSWDRTTDPIDLQLLHRITLTPHAALRLHDILARLIAEHERRHGSLR